MLFKNDIYQLLFDKGLFFFLLKITDIFEHAHSPVTRFFV